jgi:hypothetical protein
VITGGGGGVRVEGSETKEGRGVYCVDGEG